MPEDTRVTPFRQRVYTACRRIPRGRVSTYQWVAEAIGCNSARAIGQALKHNPFAPEVPCHRVIRSDHTLGGFSGYRDGPEVDRKRRMLLDEGVQFADLSHVDERCVVRLEPAG